MRTRFGALGLPWLVLGLLLAAVLLFPFYWMVLTAFRPEQAVFSYPPRLLPTELSPGLFIDALLGSRVLLWLQNTLLVAGVSTIAVIPVAALSAYALSRFRNRAVSLTALLIVTTQMMPPVLLLVPYFILFRSLGLLDGLLGLILANFAWALPVSAWLMKSSFDSIPAELEEAALVDGCSRFGAFVRIALPLALPGLATAGVFAFISSWDEYFFARTLISDSANWVISVGLGSFSGDYSTSWQVVMSVAIAATLPPALLFIIAQKAFVDNIAAGGVKG